MMLYFISSFILFTFLRSSVPSNFHMECVFLDSSRSHIYNPYINIYIWKKFNEKSEKVYVVREKKWGAKGCFLFNFSLLVFEIGWMCLCVRAFAGACPAGTGPSNFNFHYTPLYNYSHPFKTTTITTIYVHT